MRALVWHGKGDVRCDSVPDPTIEDPRDVIVKITSTAICGSDLHLYDGYMPTMEDGDILGHEPMGEVVEVGTAITKFGIGDRIVVPFTIACGSCFFCEKELYSCCDTTNRDAEKAAKMMGHAPAGLFGYSHLTGHYPGGQAEYFVEWDYPPHEAILRRATAIGADLIIAECHKGGRTRPWLIHLTDWELLRTSTLPVLLFKNDKPYHRPLTLAAVDPTGAHAKPRALDASIVDSAREFSKALRGALHMGHANYPTIVGLPNAPSGNDRKWTTRSYDELIEQEREAFEAFRVEMQVMRTRAHLVTGNPATEIPRLARDLGAQIVVMGALSRSGLMRVLIGNTAERVLEALPCDVLVVKPEEPRPRVATQANGLRAAPARPTPMAP